jgi:hypothetical protein
MAITTEIRRVDVRRAWGHRRQCPGYPPLFFLAVGQNAIELEKRGRKRKRGLGEMK